MEPIQPARKTCFLIGPMTGDPEIKRQERLVAIMKEPSWPWGAPIST